MNFALFLTAVGWCPIHMCIHTLDNMVYRMAFNPSKYMRCAFERNAATTSDRGSMVQLVSVMHYYAQPEGQDPART